MKERKRQLRWEASEKVRQWVNLYKVSTGCADCGYNEAAVAMDFDHLPEFEKRKNVSRLVASYASLDTVMSEIAKCEVVCANCHRIRTKERGYK